MLYEMAALRPAFDAFSLISLFFKIVKGKYEVCGYCSQYNAMLIIKRQSTLHQSGVGVARWEITVYYVSEKKLDPLLFHHIFALTATNCVKISRSTQEFLLVVNIE